MEPKDRPTSPDARAQHRAYVLEHVVDAGLTSGQAAAILKRSTRQVDRLLARYRDGPMALAHGNRGRAPANRLDDARRARLVELATTTYAGVNHTHLAELLAERERIVVAPRTLRRVPAEASVRPTRTRRPPRHRSHRERMPREGQLLQVDGSRHRWFGPDLPFASLVAGIDDATGRVPGAIFRAQEDAVGYFTTLAQAQVAWIGAHSAPAKGRVERLWGTLQDGLVTELRLATDHVDRNGQRLPAGLSRAPQRAVRRAGRRSGARLASVARRPEFRCGLLLPPSAPRRPRQHDQLAGRRPRPATPERWAQLVRADGHPPGTTRWQPVGRPR